MLVALGSSQALNVDPEGSNWQECNMEVNSAFKKDW